MRKIVILILCLVLICSTVSPLNVHANNDFYTEQAENLIAYLQTDYPALLQQNTNYEYVQFINNFNSSEISLYFLHMADFFAQTGVAPDEEKYKEVLLNIIGTHDLTKSGDIASQKKLDNLKTFEDYGKDTVKIGAQAVSVISGISPSTSKLEENIAMAVDGLSVLIDTTENWIDALSDLETVVQNYSYYIDFLNIVENNANGTLKNAASSLKETIDVSMEIKLETYIDVTNDNFDRWGQEFFSDDFFEACKSTEEYEADDTLRWFVNTGQNVVEKLDGLNGSWELGKMIGILVGNLTVGGENLADRLLETMAVTEIGEILSLYLQDMLAEEFQGVIGTEKETSFVQKYIAISQFLVDCRVRGEYCWYSIISNDAGLLSWFNKKTGKNAEEIYNSVVGMMEEVQNELIKVTIVSESSTIETNVGYENADENNLELTVSEICQKVAEHYNEVNNTEEYVVFENECTETEDGYTLVLRSQGGNVANRLVAVVDVNLKTREVKDEWGNVWTL